MCLLRGYSTRCMPGLWGRIGHCWVISMHRLIAGIVVGRLLLSALLFSMSPLLLLSSHTIIVLLSSMVLFLSCAFLFLTSFCLLALDVGLSQWIQRINGRGCDWHRVSIDSLHKRRELDWSLLSTLCATRTTIASGRRSGRRLSGRLLDLRWVYRRWSDLLLSRRIVSGRH